MQYISMRGRGQEAASGRAKILVFSGRTVRKWSLEVAQLSLYLSVAAIEAAVLILSKLCLNVWGAWVIIAQGFREPGEEGFT